MTIKIAHPSQKFRSGCGVMRRSGFTLTEIAIVLGIVGLVLGVIWFAAAMVYENNRTKKAVEQVLAITNNWCSIYGSRHVDVPGWTDITAMTIDLNFMPSDMIDEGVTTQGRGAWPQSWVTVSGNDFYNGIRVDYGGLTPSACSRLAMALFVNANSDLIYSDINNQTPKLYPPAGSDNYPTSAEVSADCQANSSVNYNGSNNFVRVMYKM